MCEHVDAASNPVLGIARRSPPANGSEGFCFARRRNKTPHVRSSLFRGGRWRDTVSRGSRRQNNDGGATMAGAQGMPRGGAAPPEVIQQRILYVEDHSDTAEVVSR